MAKTIVVIGGGQAAASFLTRMRAHDPECELALISGEETLPYQRPPLSKKYATGEMEKEQLLLKPAAWYEAHNVTTHLGVRVVSIDGEQKTLVADNGQTLGWDQLFLATGSRPRTLPATIGGDLEGVLVLRDIDDADRISQRLAEGGRAVIVGGGYIGLEAAAVCASRGVEVTVIEAQERILKRVACAETSDWFRALHRTHGVTILEGAALEQIVAQDGRASGVRLDDGRELDADFVLVGIGIIPNQGLAEEAGLAVDQGIIVDRHCRTSHGDVYAAGDCTVFDYQGERIRLESVQNAIDQAECAADNMSGEARDYDPHPWFWSDQYDVKLQIAGLNRGYDRVVVRPGEREGAVSHFYFRGDTFLAVDAINDPRTYMVCKKLLEAGKTLSVAQAEDQALVLKSLL